MVDLDITLGIDLLEFLTNTLREVRRVGNERKTLSVPNSFVELGGFGGPKRQYETVENDLPLPSGNVDHPRIAKKVAQVLPQGLGGRCLGGTELHEDDLGLPLGRDVIGVHLL